MREKLGCVVVTGASSGIGRALAVAYAETGMTLGLFGRDKIRLEETAATCRIKGAVVEIFAMDVMDRIALGQALTEFDSRHEIGLVIANAGISAGSLQEGAGESADAALHVLRVNVLGTLHTVLPVLDLMRTRGHGQIALMGSLAARPGAPSSPAYSASKAAIETYGAALTGALAGSGVKVSVISPGFVATPMSARLTGPQPFLVTAEHAAQLIRRRLARGDAHIRFPKILAAAASLSALLPQRLLHAAMRLTNRRPAGADARLPAEKA